MNYNPKHSIRPNVLYLDDIETSVTELNRLVAYLDVCESLVMDRVHDVHLPTESLDLVVSDIKTRLSAVVDLLESATESATRPHQPPIQ